MHKKDYLMVALVPLAALLIPVIGMMTSPAWNWTGSDFLLAWVILAATTFFFRLLVTRRWANFAYKAGAALAVLAGFLIVWCNLAVQIIGDDNPGNLFYFLIVLGGFVGVGLARCHPAHLAKVAFAMAGAILLVPVVAVQLWPTDFSPGFRPVFLINLVFVGMFVLAGLLFRHAAGQAANDRTTGAATPA